MTSARSPSDAGAPPIPPCPAGPEQEERTMMAWALFYADHGLAVFPVHHPVRLGRTKWACSCGSGECGSPAKHPLSEPELGFVRGHRDATTDLDRVREAWGRHPDANIGLVATQLDIFDQDSPGILDSMDATGALVVQTGRPGGRHIIWLADPDRPLKQIAGAKHGLGRWFGSALTGSNRDQVIVFLHGDGANGKTTIAEAVQGVLGDYAAATSFDTFLPRRRGQATNDLARLHRVRSVTASEPEEGAVFAESVIKALTGGDTVSVRFLYREHFDMKPEYNVTLLGNHKPTIRGADHGIWRRILLVPFEVTISGYEIDREFPEKLKAESEGILAWLVRMCRAWQEEGLSPPTVVHAATREYRSEEDVLGQFLGEACEVGLSEDFRVAASELCRAYHAWCREQGYERSEVLSSTMFGRRAKKTLDYKRSATGGFYLGVKIRPRHSDDEPAGGVAHV